jgi:hypothetical protein
MTEEEWLKDTIAGFRGTAKLCRRVAVDLNTEMYVTMAGTYDAAASVLESRLDDIMGK